MSRIPSIAFLSAVLVVSIAPARAATPYGVKARWNERTRLVRGAEHRFFSQVAEAIQREGRPLDLGSPGGDMHLRAGDVHDGVSYLLRSKNTHAAGPTELFAERRDAKAGTLEQRHLYQAESFPPHKMPQRAWTLSVVNEQRVDRLPIHLAKLLTAKSPQRRRPQPGDRLRHETIVVEGQHVRTDVTLFAQDQGVLPVSITLTPGIAK